jgi:predicted phage-related endonuclease
MTPTGSPPPQDGIGSSEAAAILGLDTFLSQFDVWNAKVHGIHRGGDSPMMRWGRILEDVVAADFEERTGIRLNRVLAQVNNTRGLRERYQRTLRMKGHPLITARIDRRTLRKPMRIVEVKTSPYGQGYGEAGEYADGRAGGPEGVPARVRVQVYEQLAVTGYGEAIVAVLIGGYQRRDYVIPRDDAIIADLVTELEEWWYAYVRTKTPPPVDGSDGAAAYLKLRYPRDEDDVITATPEQAALAAEYRAAKALVKNYQDVEGRVKQRLQDAIGAHAGMTFPGGRITWRAHDVDVVAWEAVAAAYRTLVEETAPAVDSPEFQDLPSTIQAGLRDLDAIASVHTLTRTDRPFRATFDEERP